MPDPNPEPKEGPDDSGKTREPQEPQLKIREVNINGQSVKVVDEDGAVDALAGMRQQSKSQVQELQDKLAAIEREKTDAQKAAEEQRMKEEGKWEELYRKREQEITESERKKQEELQGRVKTLSNKFLDTYLENEIHRIEGVNKDAVKDLKVLVKQHFRFNPENETLEVMGDDGMPRSTIKPQEFLKKFVEERPIFLDRKISKNPGVGSAAPNDKSKLSFHDLLNAPRDS